MVNDTIQRIAQFPIILFHWIVIYPREGYSHTLPIRVCAAKRGRDFEAPDLERGIHFTGVS